MEQQRFKSIYMTKKIRKKTYFSTREHNGMPFLISLSKIWKCVYQDAMQVCGVDHITHSLNAFNKLAEVGHHVLPLNDLSVSRKGRRQQSLVDKGLKAHHDGVICRIHKKMVTF